MKLCLKTLLLIVTCIELEVLLFDLDDCGSGKATCV